MKLQQQRYLHRPNAGFSLPEMMVVIVIIGLLATLVVPNVVRQLGKAIGGKAKADITALSTAVDTFALENAGRYPDSLEQLLESVDGEAPILKRKSVPKDPWKMQYMYDPPSVTGTGTYRIYTFGADKSPGGEGENADISNITIQEGEE